MVAEVGSSGTEMYYEQFLTQVLHWRLVSATRLLFSAMGHSLLAPLL
jgi:hypothetical protein